MSHSRGGIGPHAHVYSPYASVGSGSYLDPVSSLHASALGIGVGGGGGGVSQLPFSTLPMDLPASADPQPSGLIWDGATPFSFRRRTTPLDFGAILSVDLERLVRTRDLAQLQRLLPSLAFGDIRTDDVAWFEPQRNGAANAIHLFRLCQLAMESLLHVQAFLLKSVQVKEAAVATEAVRADTRANKDAGIIRALKEALKEAQREAKKRDALIAGYERAGARIQPVTYLPASAAAGKAAPPAVYPGEVYTCALCGNAFMSPHYLTQHYARRHPGFVHPARSVATPPKRDEEKQPASPQPAATGITARDLEQQLASMRASLSSQLESQFAQQAASRRAQEQRALLERLSDLESLMRHQFASTTVPREMLASQQTLYQRLADEIEEIKRELARDAHLAVQPTLRSPVWNVQEPAPTPAPAQPAAPLPPPVPTQRPPRPVSPPSPEQRPSTASSRVPELEAARPAPLAISPSNSVAVAPSPASIAPTPAPVPSVEPPSPQQVPEPAQEPALHLAPLDRLREVLLRRAGRSSYAPFPEHPDLRSRYAESDWDPNAYEAREALEALVVDLALPTSQSRLVTLESAMHAQPTARETYNNLFDLVEDAAATGLRTPQDLIDEDEALHQRWEFLPQWARMIEDKEAREEAQRRVAAQQEAEGARLRGEQERLAHEQAVRDAEAQRRRRELEEAEAARMIAEQQRMLLEHERERDSLARARALQAQPPTPTETLPPSQSGMPPPITSRRPSANRFAPPSVFSPSNQAPEGMLAGSASPATVSSPTPSEYSTSGGRDAFDVAAGSGLSSPLPYTPVSSVPLGARIMSARPSRSPVSVARPEGFEANVAAAGHAPTPIASVMPRTPAAARTPAPKTQLSVFTPSLRQQKQQPAWSPPAAVPVPIPTQIGGNFSPSSSLNASGTASLDHSLARSFGGASIMARSGFGGGSVALEHISEGSRDESAAIDSSLHTSAMNARPIGVGGISRRTSLEQEGKYDDEEPTTVVPRTEIDDQFEEMLSPRKVAPRTQPSIAVSPTKQSQAQDASQSRAVRVGAASSTTSAAANSFMVSGARPVPALAVATPSRMLSSSTHLPTPLASDRANLQPGLFGFGSTASTTSAESATANSVTTPGAPTPGPGYTPHTYNVGGHRFDFTGAMTARGHPTLEEGDELQIDEVDEPSQAPVIDNAREQQAAENRRKRREEEEALGLVSESPVTPPAVVSNAAPNNESHDFDASLDETIMLDASRRAPTTQAQTATTTATSSASTGGAALSSSIAARVLVPSSKQVRNDQARTDDLRPADAGPTAIAASPSPTSVVPQPGRNDNASPPSQAFGVSTAATTSAVAAAAPVATSHVTQIGSSADSTDIQPFTQSPSTSFSAAASTGVADAAITSSPSVNAVQPFVASPSVNDSTVDSSAFASGPAIASSLQPISQPTFLSEFPDEFPDDEFPPDEADASAVPVPAKTAAPWVRSVPSDDDDDIAGRPKGLGVIAPGSVSNARAQLLGSGFFMSPQHAGGVTPTMAQLKSARAARLGAAGEEESLASDEAAPAASPSSLAKLSKPRAAATRRNRTMQAFVLTPKTSIV